MQPAPFNPVVYRYQSQDGVSYLKDVYDTPPAWSASTAALSEYAHHAHFAYEKRPDVRMSFRAGWRITTSRRLKRVDVASKGTDAGGSREMVRRYHLGYEAGRAASLLSSMQVEGRCAAGAILEGSSELLPEQTTCPRMPAMTFGYSTGQGTYQSAALGPLNVKPSVLATPPGYPLDTTTEFVDLDGDGLKDFMMTGEVQFTPTSDHMSQIIAQNGASGTAADLSKPEELYSVNAPAKASVLSFASEYLLPLDLDGDGRLEFLLPRNDPYSLVFRPQRTGKDQWTWTNRVVRTPMGLAGQIRPSGRDKTRMLVLRPAQESGVEGGSSHVVHEVRARPSR